MAWTPAEIRKLRQLASQRSLFFTEIAKELGRDAPSVRHMARKLGIQYRVPERMGKWNVKHARLREPVFRYFLNHTAQECQKRFNLTESEFKSLMTVGYRDPDLKHLRKDTRTKRAFKHDDWIFIAAYAGLMPRGWIAKKLGRSKRGRFHVVKERLRGAGASSRYLNGLTLTLAKGLLPEVAFLPLQTKAGSPGCNGATQAQVVPWVMLEDLTRSRKIDPTVRAGIRAMARFQRYVHGARTNGDALESIVSILKGTRYAKRSTEKIR